MESLEAKDEPIELLYIAETFQDMINNHGLKWAQD